MIKRIIIIIILITICQPNHCQELTGQVIDEDTKRPLTSVNVFFNGTTRGTITDRNGNFRLEVPDNQKLPLAISAIGYNPMLIHEYTFDSSLKILMSPKIYELNEVVIVSKRALKVRFERNQYLALFRRQFLGETINSYSCKILNESDLIFYYDEKSQQLNAHSDKPLIISNKALGYTIDYFLDSFVYSAYPFSMSYTGYYVFHEDTTLKVNERIRAEKRRRLAFLGSRMHFIRALWENNLESAGFVIKYHNNKVVPYDTIVSTAETADKYFRRNDTYYISYHSKSYSSTIMIKASNVYFNRLGYFDPLGIDWGGEMSYHRVADLLPYDYMLSEKH